MKGPEPRSKAVDVVHDRGTPTPEADVNRRAAAVGIQRCFMTERLQQFIASMMNRVRVNRIQRQTCNVAAVFVKTRRFGGGLVVWFGNWFLYLAGSGICMFVRSRDWMKWEAYCAMLLYPDRPAVKFSSGNAVVVPEIRGVSIRQMLKAGDINLRAFIAAARELRRVHGIPCSDYKAAWSHGDSHLDNILYDSESDQATLIDFDTRHERNLNATQRQADDLKTVLLELLSLRNDDWIEPANCFLKEYGDATVLNELARELVIPHGVAKIFWFTRTGCSATRNIEQRYHRLQRILHQVVSAKRTT